jgi:hypothetical protein
MPLVCCANLRIEISRRPILNFVPPSLDFGSSAAPRRSISFMTISLLANIAIRTSAIWSPVILGMNSASTASRVEMQIGKLTLFLRKLSITALESRWYVCIWP